MINFNELNSVLRSDTCSGCGACVVADDRLEMKLNDDGYNRPAIVKSESSKKLSLDSIPLRNICPSVELNAKEIDGDRDIIWGAIKDLELAYAADAVSRNAGSSGGVITALTNYLLEENIVEGVINTSVGSSPFLNVSKIVGKGFDYTSSAGSRYGPSSPCEVLRELMELGGVKNVAFIGKPCDVAAARKLSQVYPELQSKISHYISFMCAGVPSINATYDVVDSLGVDKLEVSSFKYRGDGWPGLTRALTKDGREYTMSYNQSWGNILNKKLQHRCKICIDGIGEFADVVCADGWECDDKGYPIFEEKNGMSLVIARTEVGSNLLHDSVKANYVNFGKSEKIRLDQIQPFQYYRRISILARLLAMKILGKSSPTYKNFSLLKLARIAGFKMSLKAFGGLLVRRNKILKREL